MILKNMALPKGYTTSSEPDLSYIVNSKIFLDIDKKVWKIGNRELPVIENIPEEELKFLDDVFTLAKKLEAGNIEMTQSEVDKIDDEIREKFYPLCLGLSFIRIQSILTQEEEGELFGELHNFVRNLKTIEKAKHHPFYDPRIKLLKSGGLLESDLDDNFARYSWEHAEDLVGKLFEKKGYEVTVGTSTTLGEIKRQGDFGIDVEAKTDKEFLGIQVKHRSMDVGFEDVAKTLGIAQKFNKVIIVSTKSGFTSQAWKHAKDNPYLIELWDSNRFKDELRDYILKNNS